jgi:hypothetical protein
LKPNLYSYLFSPHETMDALRLKQRQERKSKVQPSQMNRRKAKPKRKPGDCYPVGSYAVAIARACKKADQAAREKAIKEGMPKEDAGARVSRRFPS